MGKFPVKQILCNKIEILSSRTFHDHIWYWIKDRGLWQVLEPITETLNKTSMGNLKSTEL